MGQYHVRIFFLHDICSTLITVYIVLDASFCIFRGILVGPGLGWMGDAHIDFEKNTHIFTHMGVSKNRGTPKWMVYNGKPY